MRTIIRKRGSSSGTGLIEVLVSTSILTLVLMATAATIMLFMKTQQNHTERLQAGYLLEEAFEAVRYLRDSGWTLNLAPLAIDTPYYLVVATTSVMATTTPTRIDDFFTRTATFSEVYRRNSDDDIVAADYGGAKTVDPDARRVLYRIEWGTKPTVALGYLDGNNDVNLGNFPSNNAGEGDLVQSITIGSGNVEVIRIDLLLRRHATTTPSNVFLEIRSGSPVGAVVASSTEVISTDLSTTALAWTPFSFPDMPLLATSTIYYMRLRSNPDATEIFSGSSGYLNWSYGDAYAGGNAYRYVGAQGQTTYTGESLNSTDFSFRLMQEGAGNILEGETYITNLFDN